jgi:hypothetical protein
MGRLGRTGDKDVKRLVAAIVIVLLGGCAAPTPTPTLTTVKVGHWSARCEGVATADCEGVAALFVNNLARSSQSVFDESGGMLSVEPRPDCPAVPDWADPSFCWQATASATSGPICMVVAKQTVSGSLGFGQVGGDDMTGRLGPAGKGWATCK